MRGTVNNLALGEGLSIYTPEQRKQQIVEALVFGRTKSAKRGGKKMHGSAAVAGASDTPSKMQHPSTQLWTPPHRRMRRRSSSSSMLASAAGKSTESPKTGLKQWLRKSLKRGSSKRTKAAHAKISEENGEELPSAAARVVADDSINFYQRTFANGYDSPRSKARASSFKLGGVLSTIPDDTGIARQQILKDDRASTEVEKIKQYLMTSKGPNWMVL